MTSRAHLGLVALVAGFLVASCGGPTPATERTPAPSATPTSTAAPTPSVEPTVSDTPTPSAATPSAAPTSEPKTTPAETAMPTTFSLSSPAFTDGSAIPKRYTCDGANVSPTLIWEGAPDGTATLALIVDDPDAPGGTFVHWVAYDMDGAAEGGLAEGVSRTSAAPREGRNDFGRTGYGGPCPPSGTHHYRFNLYALDRTLGLSGTPTADKLRSAMKGHVLAQTRLVGTYRR